MSAVGCVLALLVFAVVGLVCLGVWLTHRVTPAPPPPAPPRARASRGDTGIEVLETGPPGVEGGSLGICQVCGTEMRDDVVRCRNCKTPHHGACWKYVGHCTTFACRSRTWQPVRDPLPQEIRARKARAKHERGTEVRKKSVRQWMEEIADAYEGGHVQREARKRGQFALSLVRGGVRCSLEGKRTKSGWRVWFRAAMDVQAVPVEGTLHASFDADGSVVLRPAFEIDSRERMMDFFSGCLSVVDAVAGKNGQR